MSWFGFGLTWVVWEEARQQTRKSICLFVPIRKILPFFFFPCRATNCYAKLFLEQGFVQKISGSGKCFWIGGDPWHSAKDCLKGRECARVNDNIFVTVYRGSQCYVQQAVLLGTSGAFPERLSYPLHYVAHGGWLPIDLLVASACVYLWKVYFSLFVPNDASLLRVAVRKFYIDSLDDI